MSTDHRSGVQSVSRAIALLRAVASSPTAEASVPALARACGLNRATAWRILKTLESESMVAADPSGGYVIGLGVLGLAAGAGHAALMLAAHPELTWASRRSGETAALAVPDDDGLTYIDEVIPPAVLVASWLGRTVPLHATSTGKALLAFLPPTRAAALVAAGLTSHTRTTITDLDALAEDLRRTRERGYAVCDGELESTLLGVSAPVRDPVGTPVAIISLWGPAGRVSPEDFDRHGATAVRAADRVAAAIAGAAAGTDDPRPGPDGVTASATPRRGTRRGAARSG